VLLDARGALTHDELGAPRPVAGMAGRRRGRVPWPSGNIAAQCRGTLGSCARFSLRVMAAA